MTEQRFTLILLPWLRLRSPTTVLGVQFVPYAQAAVPAQFQPFFTDIARILSSYRDIEGNPVAECVVGSIQGAEPCKDLTRAEATVVNEAVQLLTFCGLATNEYFSQIGHYTNSSAFQVLFQRFEPRSEGIALTIRRRDGETLSGGYKHGQVKFSVPVQCSHLQPAHIDAALLATLDDCCKAPDALSRRLLQAISLYNQCHSDSDAVLPEREIVLLASALEQLFADCYGADDVACKVSTLLAAYGAIKVGGSARAGALQLSKGREAQEQAWFLHRKWAQEIYHLRSDFTHGNDPARRSWGWSVLEHLVMASFVFPLLVKVLLAQASRYSLLENDIDRLQVIDHLLNETDWAADRGNHSKWSETIQKHKTDRSLERAFEQAWDMLERSREEPGEI